MSQQDSPTHTLRSGDRVVVRSPDEILSTLDAEGCLDGVPFMPEMLDWCGKSYRVFRRIEKTCVEFVPPIYPNRRFAANDVVFLDGPRCDGAGHDGCQRLCRIFWKEAWLRPAGAAESTAPSDDAARARLLARLKVRQDATRYFCQSTELLKATTEFPGKKKPWLFRIAFREVMNGDLPAGYVAKKLVQWGQLWIWRKYFDDKGLSGSLTKTPVSELNLQPGELVRIKTRAEIGATLDANGKNRGMGICEEMTRCCGKEAEVRMRVYKIIEEKTGIMRPLKDTVMLQNMRGDPKACEECMCFSEIGDCPRGELMYWREIWLERATGAPR